MDAKEAYLDKIHQVLEPDESIGYRPDMLDIDALVRTIALLRSGLREAIFMRRITKERCLAADPGGSTYDVDWTDQMKRLAGLAGVDLGHYDPLDYHVFHIK